LSTEELLELFERARELSPEARERFLAELAAREPERAARLLRLLARDASDESIFERPARGLLGDDPTEGGASPAEALPARIGPYVVRREIGRGGMGRVFLAEQRGDGFVRRVAVKRLDRRDASPLAERRFRDEVRILAALEHVGIARFLDGGRDDGGAYLVLEYVDGSDLIAHADRRGLDVEARLRLFLEVLDAVEYAHGQRVIHRDLKPGNVLVGADGRPKLLDFGISKLLEPAGAPDPETRTELRALTPAYASPEQIRGDALSPASDIYSLGVVLYELVSGARPFAPETGDARALERAVLETEPEPPSMAAKRASTLPRTSADGATLPAPRFGRDLDAICLKALRKEPESRYATVRAFADDLARYLAGRPVSARRGGMTYALGRRLRRQRVVLVATLSAAALGALGVYVAGAPGRPRTPSPAAPASRAALPPIGELSARFAEHPDRVDFGIELVRALLDAGRGADARAAIARLRQLPDDAATGFRVDLLDAEAALRVSEFQRAAAAAAAAGSSATRAGESSAARRARLLGVRALLPSAPAAESERRLAELIDEAETAGDEALVAEALFVRAQAARSGGRREAATELLDAALGRSRALGLRRLEVDALVLAGRLEGESGEIVKGLETIDRALLRAREIGWLAGEAAALATKVTLLNWRGLDDEAGALAPLALEKLRQSGNRELLLNMLGNVATLHTQNAELAEAEAALAEAEQVAAAISLPKARARIYALRSYLQQQRGDYPGAKAALDAAIAGAREVDARSDLAVYLSDLAWLEASDGQAEPAATAATEALALHRSAGDERSALEVGGVLAWAAAERGDGRAARRYLSELQRAAAKGDSESANFVLFVCEAKVLEALGELEAAVEVRQKVIRLAEGFGNEVSVLVHRLHLAELFAGLGRTEEAAVIARDVLAAGERLALPGIIRDTRKLLAALPPPPPAPRG
jgi:serine/threonine-protein kinase